MTLFLTEREQTGEKGLMRIEEVAGANMRTARNRRAWSQANLGEHLAPYLGEPWARVQAISAAETGKRAFTAAELVTIGHVLGVSVADLLAPPSGVTTVTAGELSIDLDQFKRDAWLSALMAGQQRFRDLSKAQRALDASARGIAGQMLADPEMAAYVLDGLQAERRAHEDDEPLPPDVDPANPSGLRSDLDRSLLQFLELVEAEYRNLKENER